MEKYLYQDLLELEDTHWWHLSKRKTSIVLLKLFLTKPHPKILDIGCGTGRNIQEFQSLGQVFGIDNSTEAIKFCHQKGLKNVRLGNSYHTKFSPSTFDIVTMLDVLEHTEDQKTLSEVYRILKPGGLLLITVPAFMFLWSGWDEVLHHQRRYSKTTLGKVLTENNFKVLKISYQYSFLLLPVLIIRFFKSLNKDKEYSSDFKLSSPFINNLFLKISDLERRFLLKFNIPFGTSVICLAQKND